MTKTKTSPEADRNSNGTYSHGFDKMCKCGRSKGDHSAAAPFDIGEHEEGFELCPRFRLAK